MNLWTAVEHMVSDKPDTLLFRAICAVIDTWKDQHEVQTTIPRVEEALDEWPNHMRSVPWTWNEAIQQGNLPSSWQLIRHVSLISHAIGTHESKIESFLEQQNLSNVASISLHYMDDQALSVLPKHLSQLPNLREIYNIELRAEDDTIQKFLSSPLMQHLEVISMRRFNLGLDRSQVYEFPSLINPAPNLNTVIMRLPIQFDFRAFLKQEHIPSLKKLVLVPDWYGLFEENNPPEHFLQMLKLDVFSQLDTLEIHDGTPTAIQVLSNRRDLTLRHLKVIGRHYVTGLVENQQQARRLNKTAVVALANSDFVSRLSSLEIQQERIGDDIINILRNSSAEHLRELVLEDVDLTDSGLSRLSQMPQISGLRHLSLRSNPKLTGDGLVTLLNSPHLTELHILSLGCDLGNPYYGGSDDRMSNFGSVLTKAIAQSKISTHLRSLTITFGSLDVDAITELARAQMPNLQELNLSQNPIGTTGMKALAKSSFLLKLSKLVLDICELDDEAIQYLAESEFSCLRDLSLAYNAIGDDGANTLAESEITRHIMRLNLHDNMIGDAGIIALAQSAFENLVEIDVEQDVWNYHAVRFGDEVGKIVANSAAFAKLDALYGGIVDEYHGDRACGIFTNESMPSIMKSNFLRTQVKAGLNASRGRWDQPDYEPTPLPDFYQKLLPEEHEADKRNRDFRTRSVTRPPKRQ